MKMLYVRSSWCSRILAIMLSGMAVFMQACFDDDFDRTMKFETLPVIPVLQADGSPSPGNGGVITTGIVTGTSVEFTWVRGEDDLTPYTELGYRVYRSSNNNISTPAFAETNGTAVTAWTQNIVAIVADDLTPGTTYYFNVIVRDSDGNTAAYRTASVTTQSIPVGFPVPGNGGIITNGVVSTTSVQLNWTRAEDTETTQGNLQYRVYRSSANNISTPALAESNGTAVTGWTQDIVTAVASGLTPGIGYYFNVAVRDGDGNTTAYMTISITTVTDAVYMFPAGMYNGNLASSGSGLKVAPVSTRDTVDGLCSAAKSRDYPTLPSLNVRAFISVSAGDQIVDMTTNYSVPAGRKIIGPGGIQIGDNWADLFDNTIDASLSDAGVLTDHWWSGSLANGTFDTVDNCDGWTSTSNKGQAGLNDETDPNWIQGNTPSCSASRIVLCVCW